LGDLTAEVQVIRESSGLDGVVDDVVDRLELMLSANGSSTGSGQARGAFTPSTSRRR
jgi:hypothetical protein